ncbi:beta-ketoacyl-ACP synthase 3 [Silvibacterium acidisoli]|uniref:beta-ketoacyl-ACP synthase 3 n=1 Tax=Acidobacteriaceae bacterium ZG23-2 TaxID=2883246 RepID=UPI00406C404D
MRIAATGAAVPSSGTGNAELEARFALEEGWIARRTGIHFRPTADPKAAVSDLAVAAAAQAVASASIDPTEIGLLLLATSTPDHLLPPTAPLVAHRLGLQQAGAIDLAGACSGFLYALVMAYTTGAAMGKPVLVIGANLLSRRVSGEDRDTSVLFGDGAGAVLLVPDASSNLEGFFLGSDGSQYESIMIPAGGSREPLTAENLAAERNRITMLRGRGLYRHAIRMMADAGVRAMRHADVSIDNVDWWIPHQANLRLIEETGEMLGIARDRTVFTADRFGNSSAATIPIALDDAIRAGKIKRGQRLLLTSVGAGMISAGAVLRY